MYGKICGICNTNPFVPSCFESAAVESSLLLHLVEFRPFQNWCSVLDTPH